MLQAIPAVISDCLYAVLLQGKVVFVAPTKPLVNQQIEACYEFMGVSKVTLPCS